mmetsp:Transcript_35146/g.83950  ORF Transcript_35146/g.83950 Transcript_35146/m.83950 type:complete len:225 (+) Transcript_35146:915-1589(+)
MSLGCNPCLMVVIVVHFVPQWAKIFAVSLDDNLLARPHEVAVVMNGHDGDGLRPLLATLGLNVKCLHCNILKASLDWRVLSRRGPRIEEHHGALDRPQLLREVHVKAGRVGDAFVKLGVEIMHLQYKPAMTISKRYPDVFWHYVGTSTHRPGRDRILAAIWHGRARSFDLAVEQARVTKATPRLRSNLLVHQFAVTFEEDHVVEVLLVSRLGVDVVANHVNLVI